VTRPPSPQRLQPRYPKRVRPKTYTVAVYLVATIVVLQVGMLISVFWLRAIVVSVNVQVPRARLAEGAPTLVVPSLPTPKAPELPRLPALTATTTQAARLSVPAISDKLEQVGNLNEEAQALLHQNDLKSAAQILNTAEDLDPRNPATLKNLAETYYLMNEAIE
jgi:hypothetical protein